MAASSPSPELHPIPLQLPEFPSVLPHINSTFLKSRLNTFHKLPSSISPFPSDSGFSPEAYPDPSNDIRLDIDIHSPGTYLGCKGYKGVLDTGEKVFAKLWDGWKHSSEELEREAKIYMQLRDLWGKTIPRMITQGGWGFCHILLLEFIEV